MLKVGDKAPAFKLPSDSGEIVSLSDYKGKTVVLYFYPKDMTPGCTTEACDFRDRLEKFKKKRTAILGISRDSPERHATFKSKYKLNFPLLSDESGKVCESYGVWQEKSLYGRKFMGIVRTTLIIGADGKIKELIAKVKVNGHADALLKSL